MEPERFRQIDSIFDQVMDAPPFEREKLLDEKCAGDAELKAEIGALLRALDRSGDFIERDDFVSLADLFKSDGASDADGDAQLVGARIGAYQLKKLLGRGGMSAVYLAARIDDFEKEVAIKIVPPFENRRRSKENFRRERQILARLEHPNIARILDGGETADGKPYIVMEYVDGLPFDQYFLLCPELAEREKLELFQQVCHAVTYAHQNLIVHRDLKPSNIFVTRRGEVKLLDFGIAKLLDQENFNFAENRTFDGGALTLEYASPEQISGENITVASDVYSLGVILYELLTGTRPHNFRRQSLGEILRVVKTEEPSAPSAKSGSRFAAGKSELDLIVMKALAKDVSDRYATVNDLCGDIGSYLADEPISARPATVFYRLHKYVRRHLIESVVALLIAFLLGGWLVTSLWQFAREAAQARENRRAAYSAEMILAANEFEKSNLNRLREILGKYVPDDRAGEEDLRGFEWFFLNNLLNPPDRIATFHQPDEIWSAKFSPDGRFIASAGNDNRVRVLNVQTGAEIESEEQRGAWEIAFFPDGAKFAASSSSNAAPVVKIYDAATARTILTFTNHRKRVRALAISPDGVTAASGSQDGSLIIWNAATGAEIKRIEFSTPQKQVEIQAVRFSHSGDRLAVLGFETLVVLDTRRWKITASADYRELLDKNVFLSGWDAAFAPLDKLLAVGSFEGDVIFFDAATLDVIRILRLHQANVKSLDFSRDGKILATASWDRTVKFVDVSTGETISELRGHFAGVHEAAFAPNGAALLTAGADFNLNLWSVAQIEENALLTGASSFAFAPDGKSGVGWNNPAMELSRFDLASRRRVWTAKHDLNALVIAYNQPAELIALGGRDGFVSMFDAADGRRVGRFRAHDRPIYAICFSGDGKIVFTTHEDGMLKAANVADGAEKFVVKADTDLLKALSLSNDGRFLAIGGNNKIVKIFDAATGIERQSLNGHTKPLYRAMFSAGDESLVTFGADDAVQIRRTSDWKISRQLSGMSAGVFAAAFSPDGTRLATASDVGVIRLWNAQTGEQVLAFTGGQRQIVGLNFSADGGVLMSLDIAGKLKFWHAR